MTARNRSTPTVAQMAALIHRQSCWVVLVRGDCDAYTSEDVNYAVALRAFLSTMNGAVTARNMPRGRR